MRYLKEILGWFLCRTRLFPVLFGNHAVVLLFHRVHPDIASLTLNCPPAEFERYCLFLKNNFRVIPFGELVDRLADGRDVRGLAAINFDDGYLDNYEHAVPILEKHALPACFFIASNFIGSQFLTEWDRDQGTPSAWMTWSQVRELRKKGFEIGAHSMNHVNLGKIQGEHAKIEIMQSRTDIEQQLGESVNLFSYPFGGRQNITEANRSLVKEAGFVCCPSAYGGIVKPGSSPFYMLRQPVTPAWCASIWQMAFELLQEVYSRRAHKPDMPSSENVHVM